METLILALFIIIVFMTVSLIITLSEKKSMKRDIEIARHCLKRRMDYESYYDLRNLDGM